MDDFNRQNEHSDGQDGGWQSGPEDSPGYPQSGPGQNGEQKDGQNYWQNGQGGGQPYWQNGQSGGQPYWQTPQPYGQPPVKRNGQALASMIFGILALVSCCIPFVQFPLAVIAIVLVILSKKKQPLTGFAVAGLVMGIISIIVSIIMTFYWGYAISLMNDPQFWEIYNEMVQMYQ